MPRRSRRVTIQKRVGLRLKLLREAQALSQAELARRAQTSASQVHALERGQRAATVVSLERLAKVLRVPISAFFTQEEPPERARSEKVWYRIVNSLRARDADELESIEILLKAFDQTTKGRRTP